MPPQNETALVLFKLGLQNIRKLFHIANGIVLFPERAVCAKKRRTVSHERHAGKRFGRLPFAALQRKKSPAARDQKARLLQILGIQEFTWKAEYNAAEFLLRLPLRRRGDQNAGKILELCRCDRLHLRDWAVGGDFNQGGPGCKDQIFVGVGNKRR